MIQGGGDAHCFDLPLSVSIAHVGILELLLSKRVLLLVRQALLLGQLLLRHLWSRLSRHGSWLLLLLMLLQKLLADLRRSLRLLARKTIQPDGVRLLSLLPLVLLALTG